MHNELYDHAEINDKTIMLDEARMESTWDDLSRAICRKDAENFRQNQNISLADDSTSADIDDDDEDDDDDDEEDEEILDNIAGDKNDKETLLDDDLYRDTIDDEYDEKALFDKEEILKTFKKNMINRKFCICGNIFRSVPIDGNS